MATLLTQDPDLALLDEPINHLDLHQQIRMLSLFRTRCNQGKSVLMVLHDVNLALRFCSHLLLLFGNGKSIHGPVESTAKKHFFEQLYEHPLTEVTGPQGPIFLPD